MKKNGFAGMVLALLVALPVVADDAVAKLEAYLNVPEVAAKAHMLLVTDEARLTPACQTVEPARASRVSVFGDVVFDAQGKALNGLWTAQYPVRVCSKAAMRSVAFAARDNGVLELAPMVPGESLADPILQRDTKRAFDVAVQKMIGACNTVVVRDTQVVKSPVKLNSTWSEAWIAHACGRDVGQVLEFIPTPEGTTVKMGIGAATDGVSATVVR